MARKHLGDILQEQGLVSHEDVQKALELQGQQGGALGAILVNMGVVSREHLLQALGKQFGMPAVNLADLNIPAEIISRVEYSVASTYRIVPVALEDNTLTVAMADPLNIAILDDLRMMLNCDVRGAVSNEEEVAAALKKYYGRRQETVESIVGELQGGRPAAAAPRGEHTGDTIDLESIEEMADSAPVRKLVNLVLMTAVRDQASDVHFEPYEDDFRIRYRIDGVLYGMVPPPKHLAAAVASRIKVMTRTMRIAERRVPQDGRIMLNVAGRPVDLRVSVMPTMFGESVVIRVLDRAVVQLDLEKLGLLEVDLVDFREQLEKPNGIILVTGPTGCGKTTTLYSALNEFDNVSWKIITAEDPVEYDLPGIVQLQVNPEIGVDFAICLRHFLRHDPDKILVGEIRDLETAEMAVQASLTGHIVFSTLHTMDAPSTITRLLDIGLEPYKITASLECVVAQRLVRRICPKCKEEYEPTEEALMTLGLTPDDVRGKKLYYGRGKGCDYCRESGYRGRIGIFEVMELGEPVRELIMRQVSTAALREAAVEQGMRTLRDAGLAYIYDGTTTIEEIARETVAQEE